MKITFFSNYMNHHQLPFCMEMLKITKDFVFVATSKIKDERIKLGYEDMNKNYSFIVRSYEDQESLQKAMQLGLDSDLVIIGSAPNIFIKDRIKQNKIIFRYSERIFKKGRCEVFDFRKILSLIKNHTLNNKKKIYMLCASAYAAGDYNLVNAYKNKTFKWGYFPKTIKYDIEKLINNKNKNEKIQILWAGRLIKWKHPEYFIYLAEYLREKKYDFEITVLGNGYLEKKIKTKIKKLNLTQHINMLGAVKADQVRTYMEIANIFLFTSDQSEGWGAVANEAMNSGCVVIANKRIGSIPFLIKNNENGIIYKNKKEYLKNTEKVIINKQLREKISIEAYKTIFNTWNAKNAARQLFELKKALEENIDFIEDGPCSIAKPDW